MSNATPAPRPYAAPSAHALHEPSAKLRVLNLLAVCVPFAGLLAAMAMLWGRGLDALDLALLGTFYLLTAFGITLGFHRLFTHRSFQTYQPIRLLLAILGSMALQGPLLQWVAWHRRHHQHSDEAGDPHSPHAHAAGGWRGTLVGLFHAHVGWILWTEDGDDGRYVGDLRRDAALRRVSGLFPLWVLLGLALPAAIGGLATRSWGGAATGLLWGGLIRVLLVHHVTWSVNSICHLWGTREFASGDESRNNAIVGVLGLGEGWHNTHHAFPTSARHGLSWWQLDVTFIAIRLMQAMGLAWDVRLPTAAAISRKRKEAPRRPAEDPSHAASGERQ